jgi:PAS domain S-box-containing protein
MVRMKGSPLFSGLLAGLTLLIFVIDALTPLDVAIAVMYVVVVLLSAHIWARRGVLLATGLCLGLTLLAYILAHGQFSGPAFARMLVSLAAVGSTAFLALKSQDATNELRAREEALRRSEGFLAGAQRIAKTGSFSLRHADGTMYWSDEAARIFGYAPGQQAGMELVLRHTAPEDRQLVRDAMEQGRRCEGPLEVRHRLLLPDGELRYVHVLAHPAYDKAGQCEYLGAVIDVTRSVQAEQALHRSQVQLAHVTRVTMLGELAASIAHEVNQPLAAIATNGEAALRWLNRPLPNLDEARACVNRLLEASVRATEVIQRIRALARRSDPRHLPLDLNAVAQESVELVRRELASHQVALMLELAPQLPPVLGDRVQLQQVLINLLMNALQAMQSCAPGQAVLVLQTQRDAEGGVLCSVSDSGPGIPPEHMPRLFDAFFSTKDDGMGMGLPICRSIIETHGGRIWAAGAPAAGASLLFSLPAMDAEQA